MMGGQLKGFLAGAELFGLRLIVAL